MRIVCDSCAACYSIDDARLPAGPFKVRCKRCQRAIVVNHTAPRKPPPRWHLVIDGQEVGPLTSEEVREGLISGVIDGKTNAWRDGLPGWEPLERRPELGDCLERQTSPGLFDGVDPVAAGERNASPRSETPSPLLVASRNESSVLFSIANLTDLARGAAPGASGGGSGLIDIRGLAPPRREESPVLVPGVVVPAPPLLVAADEPDRGRWMLPAAVGIGASLLVAVVVLLVVLLQGRPATAVAPPASARAERPAPAPEAPPRQPAPLAPASPAASPAVSPARAPQPTPRTRPRRPHHPRKAGPRKQVTPVAPATRAAAAPKQEEDELSRLIRKATEGDSPRARSPRPAGEKTARPAPLPALEKQHINAGVRGVRGQVRACFDRFKVPGTARLRLTIEPEGRMGRVEVGGAFAGTPTGACLAQAFMRARFPRFGGRPVAVVYPVILQ